MAGDWERLCRAGDLSVDQPHIDVRFGDGRRHRVTIADQGEAYLISAIVVRPATVDAMPDLPVESWIRNRATQLVGFRIDRQRRLLVEGWIPKAALTAEEFQLYVRSA